MTVVCVGSQLVLEVGVHAQHDRERPGRREPRLQLGGVLHGLQKQLETRYPEHRPRGEAKPDLRCALRIFFLLSSQVLSAAGKTGTWA